MLGSGAGHLSLFMCAAGAGPWSLFMHGLHCCCAGSLSLGMGARPSSLPHHCGAGLSPPLVCHGTGPSLCLCIIMCHGAELLYPFAHHGAGASSPLMCIGAGHLCGGCGNQPLPPIVCHGAEPSSLFVHHEAEAWSIFVCVGAGT